MPTNQWLDSRIESRNCTVLDRIAELVEVNQGFHVRGWGYIIGCEVYGRTGLEQEEALELIHYTGMIDGVAMALGRAAAEAILDRVLARIEKQKTMVEEAHATR